MAGSVGLGIISMRTITPFLKWIRFLGQDRSRRAVINRKVVRRHHERDTFRFRLYTEVTPNHIRNRIEEGGQSFPLDEWAAPGHDFFQGRIGMLVDKN